MIARHPWMEGLGSKALYGEAQLRERLVIRCNQKKLNCVRKEKNIPGNRVNDKGLGSEEKTTLSLKHCPMCYLLNASAVSES